MDKYFRDQDCYAIDILSQDFCFTHANNPTAFVGADHLYLCQLVQSEANLIRAFTNTDDPVYYLDNYHNPVLTSYGQAFYELYALDNHAHQPEGYEFSELSRIRRQVANKCGLDRVALQGNPFARIHCNAVDEVSVANHIGACLRKEFALKKNRSAFSERSRSGSQWHDKIKRAFEPQLSRFPALYIQRFDCYSPSGSPQSLEETSSAWSTMLEKIDENPYLTSIVSYAWRREFIREIGFRYHLILLFNAMQADPFSTMPLLLSAWKQATNNDNAYVSSSLYYRSEGTNQIATESHPESLLRLIASLKKMSLNEFYYRLPKNPSFPHVGIKDDGRNVGKKLRLSKVKRTEDVEI